MPFTFMSPFRSSSLLANYVHFPNPFRIHLPLVSRHVTRPFVACPYSTFNYIGPSARRVRFGIGKLLLMTVPFITFGLGTWQVQRLRWKTDLISRLEERISKDPIPLPKRLR